MEEIYLMNADMIPQFVVEVEHIIVLKLIEEILSVLMTRVLV
jgi:hypothetical protein